MAEARALVRGQTLEALHAQPAIGVRLLRLVRRKPLGALSLALVVGFILLAVSADALAPYGPYESFRGNKLVLPNSQFLFGTDQFARDVFSRVLYGARISLLVGLAAVAVGTLGGLAIGLVSGYAEGRTDLLIQRFMDAFMALPTIILALAFVAALNRDALIGLGIPARWAGLAVVMVAIGLSHIPRTNRVVRGSVLSEKRNVYVEAASALGCGRFRIMVRHILPNVTAPIIVMATVTIAAAIIQEASLSFLGVGVPVDEPSWGGMLSGQARRFMLVQPWLAIWPGVAISLAVLAWNLLGDAIRDVWDPRLRGS